MDSYAELFRESAMSNKTNMFRIAIFFVLFLMIVNPSSGSNRGGAAVRGGVSGIAALGYAGAWTGATLGAPFAGVGMVPGSLLGGAIGAVAGGVIGGFGGSIGAAWLYDRAALPGKDASSSGADRGDAAVAGALGGAVVGAVGGAYIGGLIGAPFAGIGAVPGAAIGTVVGGFVGAVAGAAGGAFGGAAVYDSFSVQRR
jgi:hypothetical protein